MRRVLQGATISATIAVGVALFASWVGPTNAGPTSTSSVIGPYSDPVCPAGQAVISVPGLSPQNSYATPALAWAAYQPDLLPYLTVPTTTFTEVHNDGVTAQLVYLVATNPLAIADLTHARVGDGTTGWSVQGAMACSSLHVAPPETNITQQEGDGGVPLPDPTLPPVGTR